MEDNSNNSWHQHIAPTMHVVISEVKAAECVDAETLSGDYILSVVKRSPDVCRWEVAIEPKCGLDRVVLLVRASTPGGPATSHVYFEGHVAGPQWGGVLSALDYKSTTVNYLASEVMNPVAGATWPEEVQITAITTELPKQGHEISPLPQADELARSLLSGTGCSATGAVSCPSCDPGDVDCGCGTRPTGLWCKGEEAQLAIDTGCEDQTFECNGETCTGRVRLTIWGIRMMLTPPGVTSNACTCHFYTTFKIEFEYLNITCPTGTCEDFTQYINGGDLWPGRWISPSNSLAALAKWYLLNCVDENTNGCTYANFNFNEFLALMETQPPQCNGGDQNPPGSDCCSNNKVDVPANCP